MKFVAGVSDTLPSGLYRRHARFRYKVFVERLGWQLRGCDGLEFDDFDREDTLYVIAQDDAGRLTGSARLLPTTRPYLLSVVFPQLLWGAAAPCSPAIWELSRFAAMDFDAKDCGALSQFSSPTTLALLEAALGSARERGAQQLITVSPLGVERLLRKLGIRACRAAPPLIVDGQPLVSLLIDVIQP